MCLNANSVLILLEIYSLQFFFMCNSHYYFFPSSKCFIRHMRVSMWEQLDILNTFRIQIIQKKNYLNSLWKWTIIYVFIALKWIKIWNNVALFEEKTIKTLIYHFFGFFCFEMMIVWIVKFDCDFLSTFSSTYFCVCFVLNFLFLNQFFALQNVDDFIWLANCVFTVVLNFIECHLVVWYNQLL